ncbi:alpha-1,4-glucan--maltose-1-phosphate maltosyltransferase [Achromobacter kerstersii]|uniref:alpha-1,4-glucan--maltose-1-phosphate maltosyltransferase n=1 Tax=Achromobacter kerstersii TaxID=1353890 RepID=UPI00313B48D6
MATRPTLPTPALLRICHAQQGFARLPVADAGLDGGAGSSTTQEARLARIQQAGFNAVLIPPPWLRAADAQTLAPVDADLSATETRTEPIVATYERLAQAASAHGLALFVRVALDRVSVDAAASTAPSGWYQARDDDPARDPRLPSREWGVKTLRTPAPDGFADAWSRRLNAWADAGVSGFLFEAPHCLPAATWQAMLTPLRERATPARCLAWTPGLTVEQLAALYGAGFDAGFSSLAWWDYKADWLANEARRLSRLGPFLASASPLDADHSAPADRRRAWAAAFTATGWMANESDMDALADTPDVNRWLDESAPLTSLPRLLGGRDGRATLILRNAQNGATDTTDATGILALNPSATAPAHIDWDAAAPSLPPGDILPQRVTDAPALASATLPAADCALLTISPMPPVREASRHPGPRTEGGAGLRIAIENVSPAVNDGALPIKCVVHERIVVQADLLMDGHDRIAGELRWRAADESGWSRVPLALVTNDRWQASFRPRRIGPHEFQVAAWFDVWETYRHDIEVKHHAGVDVRLEVVEGVLLLREAEKRAGKGSDAGGSVAVIKRALAALPKAKPNAKTGVTLGDFPPTDDQIAQLLSPELARAMRELDAHAFESVTPEPFPVWVDRPEACHSAWYELFPRSQAREPGRHGTFDDVIERLPDIREMGFDVLYLPPIHPIGLRNRKGPNNSLVAGPEDVGSPYAIGSADGGHDAIEPKLGSLQDFLRLVRAADDHGMEMALDFAIQCSPDHPWLAEHPDWFSWRPDGSLRYAENPPKKYQDIVNVSFYGSPPRRPRKLALWRALRDVVLFWVDHGVRIFRVDNPHTKPLPFWQWLIAEVHGQHPDVLFLSEAFTRPKMMYRLAKVGFTQSYTYFTWRNERAELQAYLEEISQPPPADFFRPHFFVNTPDINPVFLQTSGRPGFLIRAALAATGSGLWGLYSGFELCEAAPVPGKEEYLDSEKYELRPRDWHQPGNIRAEITRLNHIRHANPALQTHRGLTAIGSGNDRVLAFVKATPGLGNVVLTVISLDPFHPQTAHVDAPFWLFGEGPGAAFDETHQTHQTREPRPDHLEAEDLLTDTRDTWRDATRAVALSPDQPYRIWRLSLHG